MEARIAQLEATVNALVTQFLPPVTQRLAALEKEVAELRASQSADAGSEPRKRQALNYETYLIIQSLVQQGIPDKEIAARTNVPYTTVRVYTKLEPKRVDELRLKKEAADAKAAKKAAKEASKKVSQAPKDATPTQTSDPAADAAVGGVVTGQITPANELEANYLAAQAAHVNGETGEVLDAEYTPVQEPQGYIVECPISPGEFGLAGWFEWTMELKGYADTQQAADGYPLYPPVTRDTMVKVQYMNETNSPNMLAKDVEWTTSGGVARWKLARA